MFSRVLLRASVQTLKHSSLRQSLCYKPPLKQILGARSNHCRLSSSIPLRVAMADSKVDKSQFILPNDTGIVLLECSTAFEALTNQEKQYSHYISQAAWYGSLICLLQTSPESPGIFVLLQKLFRHQPVADLKETATALGFTDEEYKAFLTFAAGFYGNMGNYKSFGDTKFVPNLPEDKFEKLIKASKAYTSDPMVSAIWEGIKDRLFNLTPRQTQLGLGKKGITTYFSDNCDLQDAELTSEFMSQKGLSPYNTRLFKYTEDGKTIYEICLASASSEGSGDSELLLGTHEYVPKGQNKAVTFKVTRGDYSTLMKLLSQNLDSAKEYASNDKEKKMLTEYVRSFTEGSIPAHKDGSRHWIQNKGPIIETYIGFIESYRDPYGARGEFEGFVAMVNKEMSAKFSELVDKAEHFLPLLPWPTSYEKDEFLRPDFTSLDVLTFGSSGIPAGINIPNYDDIRQSEGFKNVSLGNVLACGYKETDKNKITFLEDKDKDLFTKLKAESFEVQVGLHELLGHGSGKLFIKNADGTFNFDAEHVKHTETKEKIETWYEHNETWDTKFSVISSSYEECRAECVGIYLCLSSEILKIFGHEGQAADDIIYVNWLNMVRAGLVALEFYTPQTGTWRQAHMQARYVILRVLLEAGEDLVTIKKLTADDGKPDIRIMLDRSKINSVGKLAIGDFLTKLQVYKSTADVATAKAMYDKYSAVSDNDEPHFLSLRDIVLARKQPRKVFVQCNTRVNGSGVELLEYEGTADGMIQSFQDRFPESTNVEDIINKLWQQDKKYFP